MTARTPDKTSFDWRISSTCPVDWAVKIERSGAGFFHTPAGLALGAPRGDQIFAELLLDQDVVGLAAAVRSRCRFTQDPRHVYLPTLPAIAANGARDATVDALVDLFRREGAAEVVADAFDAGWLPGAVPGAEETRSRQEYVVLLDATGEELARRFSRHHQRGLRRGQREDWALRTLEGRQARDLLGMVQQAAAERASQRRDAFVVEPPPAANTLAAGSHWGVTTFGAWFGGAPLAAALVGWANRRVFFLRGGSTPNGYRSNAAVWLHWQIMSEFASRGFDEYNLGGAPAHAVRPEDPAHGLHRFKRDFGSEVRHCRGLRWTLSPAHVQAHRLARWAPGAVSQASRA